MIQGFLNRKDPNRFINPDEAVSFGVRELSAGGVPMKLREQRKVHVRITVFSSAIVIDVVVHCHTAGAL